MALVQVSLPSFAAGFSTITLSMTVERTGSSNDRYAMRMKRTGGAGGTVYLVGTPEFVMRDEEDIRSWTFIDQDIPTDATYTYTLQVKRIEGLGTFKEMTLVGMHCKK